MSGFWRNLLTILAALIRRDTISLQASCYCTFWISPFDVGIRTLKSDRYLQLAEAAQLDFGVRTGLLGRLRHARCAMVNVEQRIEFNKAIVLFDRVRVQTSIVFADSKFVHFLHIFTVKDQQCASATVKAKFKSGRITQSATELTGLVFTVPQPLGKDGAELI
jgi:acyl-CoA thioesterase FadM